MSIDGWDEAVGSLKAAVVALEAKMQAQDVAAIWELVEAGELGISFETLCTQLYEYEVIPDPQQWENLAEVGAYLGLNPGLWTSLKKQ